MRSFIIVYGGLLFMVIVFATIGFIAMWRERNIKD